MIGWIANVLILVGMVLIGKKCRSGFLVAAAGEAIWTFYAIEMRSTDLATICGIFVLVQIYNFRKWTA